MVEVRQFLEGLSLGTWLLLSVFLFVVMFGGSLGVVSWVLVRLPATFFLDNHPAAFPWADRHPVWRWLGLAGKNLLGLILVVAGVLLSLPGIPGQGILTILIGLMLLDFPGKRRLERKLIGRPSVIQAVNRLRGRFGRPPLVLDGVSAGPHPPATSQLPDAIKAGWQER